MATIDKRITKEGRFSFRVQIRLKGHPVQTATFARKTDAKRWAQSIETAIKEGRHFRISEAKRHPLAEVIDRYEQTHLNTLRSAQERKAHLDWWKDRIGALCLADIHPGVITEQRDKLAAEKIRQGRTRSFATINRYMAALSHVFTLAVKEWHWTDSNPFERIHPKKEPRGRVRFLSDDERVRLLTACQASSNPHLYPIAVLALSTGARKGEILGLRWRDVDLGRRVATLFCTKNGEIRTLPLTGLAFELLFDQSKVRRIDTDLIFQPNIRGAWELSLRQAGITDFRFHDLRHSCASYLAMNGATLAEIASVLGHKSLQMVKRYAHLSDSHVEGVVQRMNSKIFGA